MRNENGRMLYIHAHKKCLHAYSEKKQKNRVDPPFSAHDRRCGLGVRVILGPYLGASG